METVDFAGITGDINILVGELARFGCAVKITEWVADGSAARIEGLKKPDMASEAEALLAGKGWLPSLLRAPIPATETVDPAAAAEARAAA